MLSFELQSQSLPYLNLSDSGETAFQLMLDHAVKQLPVVENGIYRGLVKEDDVDELGDERIESIAYRLDPAMVKQQDHILSVLHIAAAQQLDIIPVVDTEKKLTGIIRSQDLLTAIAHLLNVQHVGALVVLEVEAPQYSLREINKHIEANDAQIIQLYTQPVADSGTLIITMRLNTHEVSDIVSTFQRNEYNVKFYIGEELFENELRSNYDNLMSYLNV